MRREGLREDPSCHRASLRTVDAVGGGRSSIVFVGGTRGLETRLVPEAGFPLRSLPLSGLKGTTPRARIAAACAAALAVLRCLSWFLSRRPALVVGAGGLGAPMLLYLAAAGIGTLGVIDHDTVDLSNLQRQVIHSSERVGRPKTESAAQTLRALNPDVAVTRHDEMLTADNVARLIAAYDVVIDGTDTFETRYALLRDAVIPAIIQGEI